jgi:hypothetical protein
MGISEAEEYQTNTQANIFTNDIEASKPSICTRPKTKIAFLKVHKAGSTTVMNIGKT